MIEGWSPVKQEARIRDGESFDAYIERLDDLIARLDDDDSSSFEDWVWVNLERGYCAALRAAEEQMLGDLSRFMSPLGSRAAPPRPPAERNSLVVTNALITAGALLPADCVAYS